MLVRCNLADDCKKKGICGAARPHDISQCEPCPFPDTKEAKCEKVDEKERPEVQVRVPQHCLCCGQEYHGGSQLPHRKFKLGLRVFYRCGASLSVAKDLGTGCYMLRFKNCQCGECTKEGT